MKILKRGASVLMIAIALAMASCAEQEQIDYSEIEKAALDKWIVEYADSLIDNKQEEGYYVSILEEGDLSSTPIGDITGWVEYTFTASDLYGNVGITRSNEVAYQQGTYTPYTHYVPFMSYSVLSDDTDVIEWTYLAMRSVLKIGDEEFQMRIGTKARIFMPSSIASTTTATGGYSGQYTLNALRPMIAEIEITGVREEPLEDEAALMTQFVSDNLYKGNSTTWVQADEESESDIMIRTGYPNVYSGTTFPTDYSVVVPDSPYNQSITALNIQIRDLLQERFWDLMDADGKEVGEESTAKIWYLARTLDGFVVDTNIKEIRELIYGDEDDDDNENSTVISYNPSLNGDDYIQAWQYAIPKFRYGNWGSILTNSTYAYGATGVVGYSVSDYESDYYDDYNNWYYLYYYDSNSYYDSDYYFDSSAYDTVTTVVSEILPYTPLLFDIFIEEDDSSDEDSEE